MTSDRWMPIAEREIGTAENHAPGKHNPRIVEYHAQTSLKASTDEVPWCSSFVNWVMHEAGLPGTGSAAAKSWLTWGVPCGPEFGAITVIQRKQPGADRATGSSSGYHVGFLCASTPESVTLLGGNQSDQVKRSTFLLRSYEVRGYRWPLEKETT